MITLGLVGLVMLVVLLVNGLALGGLALVARRHVHEWEVAYTPSSIYLSCRCGEISPGWHLYELPPGCEPRAIR